MNNTDLIKLKQKATRVDSLPEQAQSIVNHFQSLKIGGKNVSVPYYINRADPIPQKPGETYKPRRSLNSAQLAKGTTKEIEELTKKIAQKSGYILEDESVESVQEFMFNKGIGIDCSGFVTWVLNEITHLQLKKPLWKCIEISSSNPLKKLITAIRPVENISVVTFRDNGISIPNLGEVKAGDFLITHPKPSYNHIILISEVGFEKDTPLYIDYIQATDYYSFHTGLKAGTIIVKKPNEYLAEQQWYEEGVKENFTFTGVKADPEAAHIMRLKCLFLEQPHA